MNARRRYRRARNTLYALAGGLGVLAVAVVLIFGAAILEDLLAPFR
jgi:hypothetical protein